MFHSPTDDTVGIDNASQIFVAAKHPKSFISLAGADHLISRASDATYVARVIAAWADRYLDMAVDAELTPDTPPGVVKVWETRRGKFQQEVISAGTVSSPTSRSRTVASTRGQAPTIFCSQPSAPAHR